MLVWMAGTLPALADGQIGISYFSGGTLVPNLNGFSDLPTSGYGASLSLGLGESFSLSLSGNSQDGAEATRERTGLLNLNTRTSSDSSGWGTNLNYFGEKFWFGFSYRTSEDSIALAGRVTGRTDLAVDYIEQQDFQSFGIEAGRDWLLGNWSPSLSLSLQTQTADISRRESIGTIDLNQVQLTDEKAEGTDVGLSASLLYYHQLTESVLLAPAMGIFLQTQIDGDISGSTVLGQRGTIGERRQIFNYSDSLNANSLSSLDAGISLLVGDWMLNATYLTNLSSDTARDSILLGISYSF